MSRTKMPCVDAFARPDVVLAVAVLILNDNVLKRSWPGAVTGKLSDVAGLLFFPLIPIALLELTLRRPAPRAVLTAAVLVTGSVFAAAELVPAVDRELETVWGTTQVVLGRSGRSVPFTADPTDLTALPALLIPWRIAGVSRRRRQLRGPDRLGHPPNARLDTEPSHDSK